MTLRKQFSEDANSYYSLRSRFPAMRMSLSLSFSQDLDVSCSFMHPRQEFLQKTDDGNLLRARIDTVVLPHQGIHVVWRSAQKEKEATLPVK